MKVIAPLHYASVRAFSEQRADAVAALEDARVVYLEDLSFELTGAERALFGLSLDDGIQKNITLDPYLGKLSGIGSIDVDTRDAVIGLLTRYRETTQDWLHDILGDYADNLVPQRATYRPNEIAGRGKIGKASGSKAYRFDDTLLHPDAFKRRPMRGNRIFRIFTNVNPQGKARTWKVARNFEAFAARYVKDIRKPFTGEFAIRTMIRQTHWSRTHYDHIMLNLHDKGKFDEEFQKNADQLVLDFPPGATWFCFTDQVLHAAIGGAYCLEQTFELNIANMAAPEKSPLRILERLKGHALV
jgi:hypothetical protein